MNKMLGLDDFEPTPLGWLNKMPFGKYKGWRVRQVWAHDVEYLDWALDNVDQFELESDPHHQVRVAAEEERDKKAEKSWEFDEFFGHEFYD